jgi:hypothetical protein
VERQAGVLRLEVGSTKTKKGRTFKYAQLVELRDAIEAQWTAHEALKKKGGVDCCVQVKRLSWSNTA